ncbi:chlorite dismutase family protein [Herbaspirillum sp. NPDC101396]|uniref:chlorite dismutase family protein n=1 Tax=Herbaspirillum sp. NPDC101396 TaxID=3364005 RepID=UPI00383A6F8F
MNERLWTFAGGAQGAWLITAIRAVKGATLPSATHLAIANGESAAAGTWALQGVTSNERYTEQAEKQRLLAVQQGLHRPGSTCAALIPIRKSAAWWVLTQQERRDILETRSRHIEIGLRYLPPIARRLHHCRDLAAVQPFDFLTWFEFAPADAAAFDALLAALRETPEWDYVEREVEVRMER